MSSEPLSCALPVHDGGTAGELMDVRSNHGSGLTANEVAPGGQTALDRDFPIAGAAPGRYEDSQLAARRPARGPGQWLKHKRS